MKTPKVIDLVVKRDLCIGCGLCVYKCPSKAIEMGWNEHGFLVPQQTDSCKEEGDCIRVCPFNPDPDKEVKTEDELAEVFLRDAVNYHKRIGKYTNIYAGYSNEFRLSSSSGGLGTYILTELLEQKIINHVISVKESQASNVHYEYAISSSKNEVLHASKTKYYPVTLATALPKIHQLEGKIAIVGVACFLKAIRLAQYEDPALKKKIPILIGIICGGVKSRFFTEFLTEKTGLSRNHGENPDFRIKDESSTAGDYSFGCKSKIDKTQREIKMKTVGDMWGTGLFKANACDFCDDVTTELADISLGDAWLSPYSADGRGTNVIVTRSLIADQIVNIGSNANRLTIEQLPLDRFLISQSGNFNHRQSGLSYRMKKMQISLPKRFDKEKITMDFMIVQKLRMKIRLRSLEVWKENPDLNFFTIKMNKDLKALKQFTKLYHLVNALKRRILLRE